MSVKKISKQIKALEADIEQQKSEINQNWRLVRQKAVKPQTLIAGFFIGFLIGYSSFTRKKNLSSKPFNTMATITPSATTHSPNLKHALITHLKKTLISNNLPNLITQVMMRIFR